MPIDFFFNMRIFAIWFPFSFFWSIFFLFLKRNFKAENIRFMVYNF